MHALKTPWRERFDIAAAMKRTAPRLARVSLGLDFGTESCRAVLVGLDGAELGAYSQTGTGVSYEVNFSVYKAPRHQLTSMVR